MRETDRVMLHNSYNTEGIWHRTMPSFSLENLGGPEENMAWTYHFCRHAYTLAVCNDYSLHSVLACRTHPVHLSAVCAAADMVRYGQQWWGVDSPLVPS